MKTYLEFCPTPTEEIPEQLGKNYDAARAKAECGIFRRQLERQSPPPGHARLVIKGNEHDFGQYYEVYACFDDDIAEERQWAYLLESELPEKWDDIAEMEIAEIRG